MRFAYEIPHPLPDERLYLGVVSAVVQQHSSSCSADDEAKNLHPGELKTHGYATFVSRCPVLDTGSCYKKRK